MTQPVVPAPAPGPVPTAGAAAPDEQSRPKSHHELVVAGKPVIFRGKYGQTAVQTAKESAWKLGKEARHVEMDIATAQGLKDTIASVQPDGIVIFEEVQMAGPAAAEALLEALKDESRRYIVCTRAAPSVELEAACTGGMIVMGVG